MMTIRKMVMAQMAKGAEYITGTFTVPDSGSSYVIYFGKTLERYIFLIEATDESKTAIMESGINGTKSFAFIGIYPRLSIDTYNANFNGTYARINPSTKEMSSIVATNVDPTASSIGFNVNSLADGSSVIFRGLTYKYTIIELKD